MLGRRVGARAARSGDHRAVFRPTAARLSEADLTIGNLESTFSRLGPPTQNDAFAASPRALAGLREAGFDILSLANNHTGDFGTASLLDTVRRVRGAGIAPVGAGRDSREAWRPLIVARRGIRIGLLAFNAIGETPRATGDRPGAASVRMEPRTGPLHEGDLARATAAVRALSKRVDHVVVLPHWGAQYTHRPVRDQRTVARALVAAGADAIVGGHPHVVQDVETYRSRPILYSLGNFVFDMEQRAATRRGIAVSLTLTRERLEKVRILPYAIDGSYTPRFGSSESVLGDIRGLGAFTRRW